MGKHWLYNCRVIATTNRGKLAINGKIVTEQELEERRKNYPKKVKIP